MELSTILICCVIAVGYVWLFNQSRMSVDEQTLLMIGRMHVAAVVSIDANMTMARAQLRDEAVTLFLKENFKNETKKNSP